MATQAKITINGSPGSNTSLPLNTLVTLNNQGLGGESTYEWIILSQPEGTLDLLSSTSTVPTTFRPKKEGSYLIRLTVNKGLADEKVNQVVAAVRELETGDRIPAAGETTEVNDTTGWSNTALTQILQRVTRLTDSGVVVGVAGEALPVQGVVYISGLSTIAPLLPGERTVAEFKLAHASVLAETASVLGVVLGKVTGGSASTGDIIRVLTFGAEPSVTMTAGGIINDPVYVDDAGLMSLTPGTHSRQIGTVVESSAAPSYAVWISGVAEAGGGGASGTAGGVLGYPGSTYPNPTGLAAPDVGGVIRVAPYTGQTGLALRANDGSGADGTSFYFTAGSGVSGVYNGGAVEVAAGTSVGGAGGTATIYGGNGSNGGGVSIYSGSGSTGSGGTVNIYAGSSTATPGSDVAISAGSTSLAGGTGGAITVVGGTANAVGSTGGAVTVKGGTGPSSNSGGQIVLDGGTTKTGSVTIQTQNAPSTGSTGDLTISTGNGGTAGTPGNITVTAGNSTQNLASADGGSIVLTAGSNATTNGQGGSIALIGGNGASGNTGANLTVYGSDPNYPGASVEIKAGTIGNFGKYVALQGGDSASQNGSVIIGGGKGPGTAGNVYIGYGGVSPGPASSNVYIGTNPYSTTIRGTISIGEAASTTNITGSTTTLGASTLNVTVAGKLVETPQLFAVGAASDTIPVSSGVTRLTNALSPVVLTSTPTVTTTGIADGTRVLLFNAGTNNITLQSEAALAGSKLKLGTNTRVLGTGHILELIYLKDSTNVSYWYEIVFRG